MVIPYLLDIYWEIIMKSKPHGEPLTTCEVSASSPYDAVRLNAMRHGLLARDTVLPWEDPDAFDALHSALVDEWQPHGPTECELVLQLATTFWRVRRAPPAEAALIVYGMPEVESIPHSGMEVIPSGEFGLAAMRNLQLLSSEKIKNMQRYEKDMKKGIKNIIETLALARDVKSL
jgi:hypothetical protein